MSYAKRNSGNPNLKALQPGLIFQACFLRFIFSSGGCASLAGGLRRTGNQDGTLSGRPEAQFLQEAIGLRGLHTAPAPVRGNA